MAEASLNLHQKVSYSAVEKDVPGFRLIDGERSAVLFHGRMLRSLEGNLYVVVFTYTSGFLSFLVGEVMG